MRVVPVALSSRVAHAHPKTGLRWKPCYCPLFVLNVGHRPRTLRALLSRRWLLASFRTPPPDTPCRSSIPATAILHPDVRAFHDVRMLGYLVRQLLLRQPLLWAEFVVGRFVNCLHRNPFAASIMLRLHPCDNFLHQSVVFLRHFCITSATSDVLTAYNMWSR